MASAGEMNLACASLNGRYSQAKEALFAIYVASEPSQASSRSFHYHLGIISYLDGLSSSISLILAGREMKLRENLESAAILTSSPASATSHAGPRVQDREASEAHSHPGTRSQWRK